MTEKTIQDELYRFRTFYGGTKHQLVIPNAVMRWGEVDLLSVTPAGFIVEHEIKISRSDFKADRRKIEKHSCLSKMSLFDDASDADGHCCPNYFFYVVPKELIKTEEVPDYAGLIYVGEKSGWCDIVKNAPRLHKEKIDLPVALKLASKMMVRYWKMRLAGGNEDLNICQP